MERLCLGRSTVFALDWAAASYEVARSAAGGLIPESAIVEFIETLEQGTGTSAAPSDAGVIR